MKRFVRCMAHGDESGWEAYCLDFDLAVQGKTFEDVQLALNGAVQTYLEDVLALPPADQKRLLNRRAPLSSRLRWACAFMFHLLFAKDNDSDDSPVGFHMPCHA